MTRSALLAFGLLLFVCSSAGAQATYVIPLQRQASCTRVEEYIPTPALTSVVDSAALHDGIQKLLSGVQGLGDYYAGLRIAYATDGSVRDVEVSSESLRRYRGPLEQLTRSVAQPQPPRRQRFEWWVTVESDSSGFSLEVAERLVCRPQLSNGPLLSNLMSDEVDDLERRGFMRRGARYTTSVRMVVTDAGLPSEIKVARSSGSSAIDDSAVKIAQRMYFYPGLKLEGTSQLVPVRVLVELPVTLVASPAPPGGR